jgi:sulfite reductase (NADPH) flavoprotein alpha-component
MARKFHSLLGLIAAIVVTLAGASGAILATQPLADRATASAAQFDGLNAATLASRTFHAVAGLERLEIKPSGTVVAHHEPRDGVAASIIEPDTGEATGPYRPSQIFGFVTELHRSLFIGTAGRAVAGIAAAVLFLLIVSGTLMLVKRLGGWKNALRRARGTVGQRLHVDIARIAIPGLLMTSLTGCFLSLVSFGLVPDGSDQMPPYPEIVDAGAPLPVSQLPALAAIPANRLRELVFPYPDDPGDVYTVTTADGQGFVDQATGALTGFEPHGSMQKFSRLIYVLHTGEGVWLLALGLGLFVLCVPILSVTGTIIWWRRSRSRPRLAGNCARARADTIILVGSEGNITWGFAATLHKAMTDQGHRVHTGDMNSVCERYARAKHIFILTSTYGEGGAPSSANRFLERIARIDPHYHARFAVLGFGDRQYPQYCKFAVDAEAALRSCGWRCFHQTELIDRQSSEAFAQWGLAIGQRIGSPLVLKHAPARPEGFDLVLAERRDYRDHQDAQTAIFDFLPVADGAKRKPWRRRSGNRLPQFDVGDLLGITPPGASVPRYYSLASARRDGIVEICVKRHPSGLCSNYLHGLNPGDRIEAFTKSNPDFKPRPGKAPVILIGAGTGIAPLAGFARGNQHKRSLHLYWGGRDPHGGFLYSERLKAYLGDARLTRLVTAFSRIVGGAYVQDMVLQDASTIRALVASGAQIMVCGSRDMAGGVRSALDAALAPADLNVARLRESRRYLEDVY